MGSKEGCGKSGPLPVMFVIKFLFPEGLETSVFLAGVGRFRRRDRRILHHPCRGKKEQF